MDEKQQPPVPDLPAKPVQEASASDVKGGAMGRGTQTEDDVYVGVKKR